MPNRRCAIKELRKTKTRKLHNLDIKTQLRKTVKQFMVAIDEKKVDDAKNLLKQVYKKFDKATKHNILQKNTTSRRKARYSKLLASISS